MNATKTIVPQLVPNVVPQISSYPLVIRNEVERLDEETKTKIQIFLGQAMPEDRDLSQGEIRAILVLINQEKERSRRKTATSKLLKLVSYFTMLLLFLIAYTSYFFNIGVSNPQD